MAQLYSKYTSGTEFSAGAIVGKIAGASGLNPIVDRLNSISTSDNVISGTSLAITSDNMTGSGNPLFGKLRQALSSPGNQRQINKSSLTALGSRISGLTSGINHAQKASSPPVLNSIGGVLQIHRHKTNGTPVFIGREAVSKLSRRVGKAAPGTVDTEIDKHLRTINFLTIGIIK